MRVYTPGLHVACNACKKCVACGVAWRVRKKFQMQYPNRKYVSLYSKSSIENVHCRIVQMTKSNRKLQCIAYTHFEMFLLFCVSCKFLQSMRSRQNRICSATQMLSKDYASHKMPKVHYLDLWIVYNIIDCDCQ